MAKDESNIHVYGDLDNSVFVSASGATVAAMPADLAVPGADFTEVGWISEDGVKEGIDANSETFRAWQGATVVRKQITQSDRSFVFTALEENAVTAGLKYRGAASTTDTLSKTRSTVVKNQTKTDIRSWVVDLFDDAHHKRYAIPEGFYEVTGEQTYAASGITMLEITVTPIGEYTEIVTDPTIV